MRFGTSNYRFGDAYFHWVNGPWWRLLVVFFLLFLVTNAVFALLYMLDPRAIAGSGSEQGVAEAFFVSVQAVCTIGCG